MSRLSKDEIRHCFESARAFNQVLDAFEQAIGDRMDDVELYRKLFWNKFLSSDELCLFGHKLANEFPPMAYEVFLWLASVFAVNYSRYDNYELAMDYFAKASTVKPAEPTPYLDAAACYEPDLNIPPVTNLLQYLKDGTRHVENPRPLYERLCQLYDIVGNDEMSKFYRMKLDPGFPPPSGPRS